MNSSMNLPHLPLWPGAVYRLVVCSSDPPEAKREIIPVRLLSTTQLPFPRTHVFEHPGDDLPITVTEHSSGKFFIENTPITIEFA